MSLIRQWRCRHCSRRLADVSLLSDSVSLLDCVPHIKCPECKTMNRLDEAAITPEGWLVQRAPQRHAMVAART